MKAKWKVLELRGQFAPQIFDEINQLYIYLETTEGGCAAKQHLNHPGSSQCIDCPGVSSCFVLVGNKGN